jgi:hypothetical protein
MATQSIKIKFNGWNSGEIQVMNKQSTTIAYDIMLDFLAEIIVEKFVEREQTLPEGILTLSYNPKYESEVGGFYSQDAHKYF